MQGKVESKPTNDKAKESSSSEDETSENSDEESSSDDSSESNTSEDETSTTKTITKATPTPIKKKPTPTASSAPPQTSSKDASFEDSTIYFRSFIRLNNQPSLGTDKERQAFKDKMFEYWNPLYDDFMLVLEQDEHAPKVPEEKRSWTIEHHRAVNAWVKKLSEYPLIVTWMGMPLIKKQHNGYTAPIVIKAWPNDDKLGMSKEDKHGETQFRCIFGIDYIDSEDDPQTQSEKWYSNTEDDPENKKGMWYSDSLTETVTQYMHKINGDYGSGIVQRNRCWVLTSRGFEDILDLMPKAIWSIGNNVGPTPNSLPKKKQP